MQQIVQFVMKSFGGSWGLEISKRKTPGKCLTSLCFHSAISRELSPPHFRPNPAIDEMQNRKRNIYLLRHLVTLWKFELNVPVATFNLLPIFPSHSLSGRVNRPFHSMYSIFSKSTNYLFHQKTNVPVTCQLLSIFPTFHTHCFTSTWLYIFDKTYLNSAATPVFIRTVKYISQQLLRHSKNITFKSE